MPLSFRQAGNLFVAGPNITIFSSGNTFAISGSPFQGGVGSGVTGVTSSGTGQYLFLLPNLFENNILQKAISAGTGMNITEDGLSEILTFSVAGANIGSAVTGLTSAGTGNRLIFSSITNNNLVQKSLSGGTGIAIIDSGTGTLTFSATTTGSSGTIISGTNLGTGTAVFSGVVGTNMVFRTLRGGLNANVFLSGSNIVISATTGAINGITALTNVGGGIAIASSVTNNTLISRTLGGANGLDVIESGNLVVVRLSTGFTANRFIIAGTGGALTTSEAYQFDSTVGTMTLGFSIPTSNVSSRLLIEAGNANLSQIRLTSFSAAYTGATAGDIWYNSTSGNTLFFNKSTSAPTPFIFKDNNYSLTGTSNARILNVNSSGTINTFAYLTNLGIFNALISTTISGTNELSIFNTGATFLIGTHILNSSTHGTTPQLVSGKKYRFNAKGLITTSAASAGNLIARMKLGSVLVASSTTALQTSISSNYFEINTTFTIRAAGSLGTVIGSGYMLTDNQFLISGVSNIAGIYSLTTSGVTINTTVDTPFDFTLQNSSQPNNTYIINEATLEYLN
jgi:hypothetical protein